ncbi:hypothetical protein PG993_009614 [Apiospora rasikravindrae]|uniref:Uncharacterized protein n=1 Tax=Apiospora rasikravindrae TaxID=990691 RepID=A0ABR1SJX9_9PEZI
MNWKKLVTKFIDDIPDEKLQGFRTSPGLIWRDVNFRLNMQGLTTAGEHNLQIQVNNATSVTTLKPLAPNTIAGPVFVAQSSVSTSAIKGSTAKSKANGQKIDKEPTKGQKAKGEKPNEHFAANQKNDKPTSGKQAADQKDVQNANANGKGNSKVNASGKADANGGDSDTGKSSDDSKAAAMDPEAIRKAFKATLKPLDEIVGPGKQGKPDKKAKKGKK